MLKGRNGSERLVMDVRRRGLDSHMDSEAQAGVPLTLTIDERMQYVAERELKAGVEAKHARSGTAIVMNPYTGEILALANYPTYDPNMPPKPGDDPHRAVRSGRVGSIRAGVGVQSGHAERGARNHQSSPGLADPDRQRRTGSARPRDSRIAWRIRHDHDAAGAGEIEQHRRDHDRHATWAGKICTNTRGGLGSARRRVCRFPPNRPGSCGPSKEWGTTSLASVSMGQEVSVTSVQLARLGAVIANGGMLVKPRLILKRGDKAGACRPAGACAQARNGHHDA